MAQSGSAAGKRGGSTTKKASGSGSPGTSKARSSAAKTGAAKRSAASSTATKKPAAAGRGTAKKGAAKSTAAKSTGARKTGATKSAAKRSAAAKKGSASKSATTRSAAAKKGSASKSATTRSAAAKKGGQASARKAKSRKAAGAAASTASKGAKSAGLEAKTVAEFRTALRKNLIKPLEMVMLSRDRIEEVLGEAVDQGRVTTRDAQRITAGLVKLGQQQTTDVLKDLEGLFGRGKDGIEDRTSGARKAAGGARKAAGAATKDARGRAVRAASPALAQADRVRRVAGVGPSFPIIGYDALSATQVQTRLGTLTPAQLRKVRDHERRGANRSTVLNAIEAKLG